MPHDNLGTPNFLMSGTVLKLEPCHPQCGCQMQVGWVKIDNFRQIKPQPGAATVCVRRFFSCHPVVFSYPDTIRYEMLLNDISGIFLVYVFPPFCSASPQLYSKLKMQSGYGILFNCLLIIAIFILNAQCMHKSDKTVLR